MLKQRLVIKQRRNKKANKTIKKKKAKSIRAILSSEHNVRKPVVAIAETEKNERMK